MSARPAALALALLAVLTVLPALDVPSQAAAGGATQTTIGIDAITEGNDGSTIGSIDDCAQISQGDSHQVDVYITDVSDLLAWEAYLAYDPDILEVQDVDTTLFLATSPESDAQDASVPGEGQYQLVGFDAADPLSPDSGSGVLARVTLKGKAEGVSALELPLPDIDGDGNPDRGPLLQDPDANAIGDTNGDTLFDGEVSSALIAVDASCGDAPSSGNDGEPNAAQDDDSGIGTLTVVAIVAGFAAAIGIGGLAVALATRSRSRRGD